MKFTWDPKLYDNSHDYVSKFGLEILTFLNPKDDDEILDIGCGTGDLTKTLSEHCKEVVGLDNSSEMLDKAKEKYPLVKFIAGDAKDFYLDRTFDVVFSNAALHWIPDAESVIRNINRHLKVGGRIVAEFGGKGCINTIISELVKTLNEKQITFLNINGVLFYPSISEYSSLLESNGFEVTYARLFARSTELNGGSEGLRNFIEMFLSWLFKNASDEEKTAIIDLVAKNLKETLFTNNSWHADYKRIQIIATKTR